MAQIIWLLAFALVTGTAAKWIYNTDTTNVQPALTVTPSMAIDAAEAERCTVPDFAKAMGHEEKWKLHNNCK